MNSLTFVFVLYFDKDFNFKFSVLFQPRSILLTFWKTQCMVYYVVINAINFNSFNNHMGITASAYKLQKAINNK